MFQHCPMNFAEDNILLSTKPYVMEHSVFTFLCTESILIEILCDFTFVILCVNIPSLN